MGSSPYVIRVSGKMVILSTPRMPITRGAPSVTTWKAWATSGCSSKCLRNLRPAATATPPPREWPDNVM
eukprot:scaffold17802_cov35-Tisochrysis_lutea.AAC.3